MKRSLLLLLLLPALLIAAVACSSDDDGDEGTTEATATAETTGETTATAEASATEAMAEPLVFGMILVGPRDDHGWSQAHFEAGQYLEENLGAQMIVVDKVNPADSPNLTIPQVVDEMIAQGAKLIFATSDDMKDGILEAAAQHPEVPMIWSSGDNAWSEGQDFRSDLTNLGNVMGQMEYGKMIAGCAAALQSETG